MPTTGRSTLEESASDRRANLKQNGSASAFGDLFSNGDMFHEGLSSEMNFLMFNSLSMAERRMAMLEERVLGECGGRRRSSMFHNEPSCSLAMLEDQFDCSFAMREPNNGSVGVETIVPITLLDRETILTNVSLSQMDLPATTTATTASETIVPITLLDKETILPTAKVSLSQLDLPATTTATEATETIVPIIVTTTSVSEATPPVPAVTTSATTSEDSLPRTNTDATAFEIVFPPTKPRSTTSKRVLPITKNLAPVLESVSPVTTSSVSTSQEGEAWMAPALLDGSGGDCPIPQKPMLARPTMRQELSTTLRPDSSGLFTPPAEPFLPPVDAPTPPPTGWSTAAPASRVSDELDFRSVDETDEAAQMSPTIAHSRMLSKSLPATRTMASLEAEERERAFKFRQLKEKEQESVSSASAPAALESAPVLPPGPISGPATAPAGTVTATQILQLDSQGTARPLTSEVTLEPPALPPTPTAPPVVDLQLDVAPPLRGSVPLKRTRRAVAGKTLRGGLQREPSRGRPPTQSSTGPFPDSLRPVERPRETLQQAFQQMDSSEWEVTMQGLQALVRLMRHHPTVVQGQVHNAMVTLARQVRNLRSQVSRAACQASGELFDTLHRAIETDLDELAGPLFHRSADTNKFLRADCNTALDKMVEAVSPARAVAVIVTKGASHQHAIVRTAAARLLTGIVTKMGPERVMLMPRETRDRILTTGAAMLTEGSLETRCFAKQLFRTLSTHANFTAIITEVIPAQVLRNIAKTLQSLK